MNHNKPYFLLLLTLALLVNFIGVGNDFFSDDPGLYASISKALIYKKDLLQLYSYGQDWLDKPHFPFWAVFVSFKLFGINTWAYRLPALLFFVLSLWYTYLFTRKFYTPQIALTAVLILSTAEHILISNVDVRAEPYLMGLIMGSIYHISRLYERYTLTDILLAAFFTAGAVMTKGLFVMVAIYGALLGQLLFNNKLGELFRIKWWLLFMATVMFTLPEIYALYIQFDMHPEKIVFNRSHVSGIQWFLWNSQFGRFVNNGPITQKKGGDVFFFIHTLLWAFAPWCLFFYYALYNHIKSVFQKVKLTEYYTLSGAVLLLLLFSVSRFQLPFYTNAVFPLFAIITAPFFYSRLTDLGERYWKIIQWTGIVLLPIITITIACYSDTYKNSWFITGCILFGFTAFAVAVKVRPVKQAVFLLNCCAVLFANFFMNTVFFKTLASYNGQITAAAYVNQLQKSNLVPIYSLSVSNNVFQFYCKKPVKYISPGHYKYLKPNNESLAFISSGSFNYLKQNKIDFKIIKSFINYPQENILPAFINIDKRNKVLDHVYLISK